MYSDVGETYYDYPYLPEEYIPVPEEFIPSQTEKINNNFLYDEYNQYYGAEARTIEDQIDRAGQPDTGQQTVEEALYIIGK